MHIASSCSNNRYTSSRRMHQVYIIPSSLSRKGLEHQFLHILICPLLKFMPSNQSVKPACYNYSFKPLTFHRLCIKTLDSLPGICMTACTSSTSYCCCWVVWRNLQHWIIILRLWGYLLMLYMHWCHFKLITGLQESVHDLVLAYHYQVSFVLE